MLYLLPLERLKCCGSLLGVSSEGFKFILGVWSILSASATYQDIKELPLIAFDKRMIEASRLLSSLERAANEEGAVDR